MTIGNDGNAPSRQGDRTTSEIRAHLAARRSRGMPILIGIVVLLLIAGGIYLYADRERDNEITGNNEPNQTAENKPAPAPQPPAPSPPSAATPPASQPPSAPEPAAPERSAAQSAPNQTAQAPAPADPPAAQTQPMRQQSTNLPDASDTMSVRVASANIRSAPNLRARVVVTAHKGTKVKVLSHSGKWVQVETDGRNGWINSKMLGSE